MFTYRIKREEAGYYTTRSLILCNPQFDTMQLQGSSMSTFYPLGRVHPHDSIWGEVAHFSTYALLTSMFCNTCSDIPQ